MGSSVFFPLNSAPGCHCIQCMDIRKLAYVSEQASSLFFLCSLEDMTPGPQYFLQKVAYTKWSMPWKPLDMQAPVWGF